MNITAAIPIDKPAINLDTELVNYFVLVKISDNGKGISPEVLDNIFIPFFTTKEKGSGIGLSLSRQIMHLHGGNISVKSESGNTIFTLHF
jgi:signal transduction histidine kinase